MVNFKSAALFTALLISSPSMALAQDRNFVQGFGGFRLENTPDTGHSLGGLVAGHLTPNIQVVGEAGHMSNVLPSTFDTLLGFSPVGFGVSAFYGTGGVRFTSSNTTGIRPYAETSAGFARLHSSLRGIEGFPEYLGNAALAFLDQTEPTAGVGGGVTFESGAFVADVGYRYRRIFGSNWVDALAFGDTLHSNEVRVGVGVRF